ncbi:MAG TPA: Wzz/FepE/Etk N-terminal domain-containing protein [Steroidobacteraceae bacterium]|nr:Wzz/FepE/Etk N-terminal domain-containing protein [Steroidobacteraceae bacterium]
MDIGVGNLDARSSEVRFVDVWAELRRNWWIVFGCLLLSTATMTAVAYLMHPAYRVELLLAPSNFAERSTGLSSLIGRVSGLSSLVGSSLQSNADEVEENFALLGSAALAEQFITDKDLLPVLFQSEWDVTNKRWLSSDPADVPTMDDALELFDRRVRKIDRDQKTGLVTFAIEWRDRVEAATWANELVARVNKLAQTMAADEANKNLEFLQRQLQSASTLEERQAIFQLIEASTNARMVANVHADYAFRVLDPGRVPAENRFVRPKRLLLMASGLLLGLVLGCLIVLTLAQLRGVTKH